MSRSSTFDGNIGAQVQGQLLEAQQAASRGDKSKALSILHQMLSLKATGTFWASVAQQLYGLSDLHAAEKAARKNYSSHPDDAKAGLMLAMILGDSGKLREALSLSSKAVKKLPTDATAHYGHGLILARDNKPGSALKRFRKAVELQPDHVEAIEYIAYLGSGESQDIDFKVVDDAISRGNFPNQTAEAALWYARATLLERDGNFEEAFHAYEKGASLIRACQNVDISAIERYIDRLETTFSSDFFGRYRKHRYTNRLPVFIVGMPRSGTTLVETVLAAHSKVASVGETTLLRIATMQYGSFEPADLTRLDAEIQKGRNPWADMGLALKKAYAERVGRGRYVTEKNLGHHYLLGVTSMIAHGAPVIYCTRDVAATAWSCYKTRFTRGNAWSYDFDSIHRYQQLYSRLMRHWQATLPDAPILTVRYEELVSTPSELIPRIVKHAGLKFEPACMTPHKANVPVMTASMAQVREPIHTGAVSGWRRYSPWLREKHAIFQSRNAGATYA